MESNKNSRSRLANRQIEVGRRNLISICRFAVKSLIDKACFSNIDDGHEEFINFCAVLEQVLLHRIKSNNSWYRGGEKSFWEYVRAACRYVPQSCITSIDAIENIKSPAAKGRAFIRCGLMEKKLSEYIAAALKQTQITRKYYMDGAILLSDDSNMLCGILLGLNAIDFSFCLKGANMDLQGPLAVDFTPFLRFQQSQESLTCDRDEMDQLSNCGLTSSIMSEDMGTENMTLQNKYKNLEHKYKSVCEQKGYLEELVRMRERQAEEISRSNQNMEMRMQFIEAEAQRDRMQLEQVVLELQEQLGKEKSERKILQQRISLLLASKRQNDSLRDIQMAEIAREGKLGLEMHGLTDSTDSAVSSHHLHNIRQQDNKSLQSESSGQFTVPEDSHSMIPLTGSLTDVQMKPGDTPVHQIHSPALVVTTAGDKNISPEPEYRERPPSQAYPSFSYVDLDTSQEHEESNDSTFNTESEDPLGIGKHFDVISKADVSQDSQKEDPSALEKKVEATSIPTKIPEYDSKPSEPEVRDHSKSSTSSDDDLRSTISDDKEDAKSSASEEKEDAKSSKSEDKEDAKSSDSENKEDDAKSITSEEKDDSSTASDVKEDDTNDVNNSNVEDNSKTDSGNSDYDIVNADSGKSSSTESSVELAASDDSVKSLGDSTEEEYLKINEEQVSPPTEAVDHVSEDSKKDDPDTAERDSPEALCHVSNLVDKEESKLNSEFHLPVDSGSSEGDRDWDRLSDSSGNGQTTKGE